LSLFCHLLVSAVRSCLQCFVVILATGGASGL